MSKDRISSENLFKSMVLGGSNDLVEVYRTLRLSGPRDAVLRTLGQSAVLCGIRDLGSVRLEGRMDPICLLDRHPILAQVDPERVAKAIIAAIRLDPRLVAALRRELDTIPHPGGADGGDEFGGDPDEDPETPSDATDPFSQGRW